MSETFQTVPAEYVGHLFVIGLDDVDAEDPPCLPAGLSVESLFASPLEEIKKAGHSLQPHTFQIDLLSTSPS
ncbi:uncharacterized protein SPSK_01341 [Sporothrix schenckii 1099-18]|uniref:Uncharacterized protein n=1 Tax=Sporothrix schenckii 1099-18 TaxID=1397361 RepID=A0A0F2LX33_SPOSC|nr:uncharacterized protein SPSK_01341 [Sporothrix schenckii 1099-18]KJR81419.1 hypothetical protein SPSK_01341 [Sporothrix schenckii 1099-18]